MRIYNVPATFQLPDLAPYPTDNTPDFEHWFWKNYNPVRFPTDRVYLPIMFTAYFKSHQYGKNKGAIDRLQDFVDSLPEGDKYFCIVQYDDGTLIDWKGKDVRVFAMSGKPEGSIPIPLVCQRHSYQFDNTSRDIPVSFVGRITNPIRKTIVDYGKRRSSSVACLTDRPHSLQAYCDILSRSKVVLCPRGYGASSFRIAEALQYGAMPMIISNEEDKIFPCPVSCIYTYGIFDDSSMEDIMFLASGLSQPTTGSYERIYSFEAVKRIIYNSLWDTL